MDLVNHEYCSNFAIATEGSLEAWCANNVHPLRIYTI